MKRFLSPSLVLVSALALCLSLLWSACGNQESGSSTSTPGVDPEISQLNAQIEADPKNAQLYYQRGRLYWEREGYDEAMADAIQALDLDSLQPVYYHLLADALIDYGRPNDSKRALEVLEKACMLFPEDELTWLKTSEFYLIVRKYGEALQKLDHILQRDPQNAEAYFMSGRIALDKGDTLRAIKSLQKSVTIDAENKDAWIFLGRIFSNKGNVQALQYFDNALRLDSTDVQVKEYKAGYYKAKGDYKKAFDLYRGLVVEHPDYSNAYFDMGLMYLEQDSIQRAYEHFDRAVRTDPLFVMAYYYRGVASEAGGNLKSAIEDYQQAASMSPNLPEPKEALQRLNVQQ
jgi:tetratricopeptide (TPR) repeat protein